MVFVTDVVMRLYNSRLENIGMQSLAIADVMVSVAMKSMHVSSISTYKVQDIRDFIVE